MSIRALMVYVGMSGAGKTTLLQKHSAKARRAIIADHDGMWPLQPGDQVLSSGRDLVTALRRINAWDPKVPFRFVVQDRIEALGAACCGGAYAVHNCTLILDEVAKFCTPSSILPELNDCIQYGRKRRINLLATTRVVQELNDTLFSQSTTRFFFHQEPGLGLERIRKQYPQLAEDLPGLPAAAPPLKFVVSGNIGFAKLIGQEGVALSHQKAVSMTRN